MLLALCVTSARNTRYVIDIGNATRVHCFVEEVRKVLSQVLTSSASTKALAKQESSTIGKGDGYDYYAATIHAHPFFLPTCANR